MIKYKMVYSEDKQVRPKIHLSNIPLMDQEKKIELLKKCSFERECRIIKYDTVVNTDVS